MPRTQRGGCDINRGTGVTQSRSSIYLILIWLSTTSCPAPCRSRKKGGDDSDPPRNGGLLRPQIAARCPTPLSGPMRGRYRPYLSLREGSEKDHNGGARREGGRHWCSIPFPSPPMIPDRSSPSRVNFAVENSPESHKPVEISDLRPCVPCVAQGIPRVQPAAQRPLTGR